MGVVELCGVIVTELAASHVSFLQIPSSCTHGTQPTTKCATVTHKLLNKRIIYNYPKRACARVTVR